MHAATTAPRSVVVRVTLVVALSGLLGSPGRAALVELEGFDRRLAAEGVGSDYSEEGLLRLLELLRAEVERVESGAAAAKDDDDAEELEHRAETIGDLLDEQEELRGDGSAAAKAAAFSDLKSLLYSLRADARPGPRGLTLGTVVGILGNFSLKVPYLTPDERSRPLGPEDARLESAHLVDPQSGREYARPVELAGLSSEAISRLDVRPDDTLWYAEAELSRLAGEHGSAWKALEARIERRVAERRDEPYALDRARRLLVLDEIDDSGTSPKIDAEDLAGEDWSVKWGEEIHSEAVATRLWVELGGKLADPVYANHGPDDLVLVLHADKDEDDGENGCATVATFEGFERCLLESKYAFDVSPYVLGRGTITRKLLEREPFASAPGDPEELVGREFVTFNESLVGLRLDDEDFLRLGAAPMSSGGALEDRVKRGLAVFNYWILNKDAKDANNRGVIDPETSRYLEYMHDLGASLGSLIKAGSPNLLAVGERFLRRRGSSLRFRDNLLYVPRSFEQATFADALWMARKIAALPRETILDAVAATRWPDFQQDVLASRLIARRDAIAEAFDLGPPLGPEAEPTALPVGSREDRLAVVRRYRLAVATEGDEDDALTLLEQALRDSGVGVEEGGLASVPVSVLREGSRREPRVLETASCRESAIIALLERTLHPSGLSRRVQRRSDAEPLEPCRARVPRRRR